MDYKYETTEGAKKINILMTIAGGIQLKKVKKAGKNCAKTEEQTLRGILEYAKDSEWGKAHNFEKILAAPDAATLYKLWRENVPPTDYEDFRPYIDRCKNGEENVLYPGKAMMYATTSGTTGQPKWIPITPEYYNNVYSKMTKLWLYSFIMHRPTVFTGRNFSVVGKAIEGKAQDGTVYGSVSGVTRRDCPGFIDKLHSSPYEACTIDDYHSRFNTIIRVGLGQNVGSLITANPSTVGELVKTVNENFDDFVDQIEKGTLNPDYKMAPETRAIIESKLSPNPARAQQLRELKAKYGEIYPKHYWPNLIFLTTWKCGNTKSYMGKFNDWFAPEMLHQEFGYFASECRAGLVLNGQDDTVLFAHMHYFEFVREEDSDKENKEFLNLSQLEKGKRYIIYVTTYAGLYRYCMNDIVECTGFFGQIPTIQFIMKTNGIVSMTGEKIHETQFINAVRAAEKETGYATKMFVGFADLSISAYQFFYEFEDKSLGKEAAEKMSQIVDRVLGEENVEWKCKRDTERVKDPVSHVLKDNSMDAFKQEWIRLGRSREGQFKLNVLMQNDKALEIFKTLEEK